MRSRRWIFAGLPVASLVLILNTIVGAFAGGSWSRLALSCDNGHSYPIRPIAISALGDLVTAYIEVGRGRGIHIRLIPMGDGYRYAGRGIWFDGVRSEAILFFGTPAEVACTVIYD
jgi:hypothetical protein